MMSFRRGVWIFIYSPEEEPSALGSNRLHEWWICILGGSGGSLWNGIEESLYGGARWPYLAAASPSLWSRAFWCLMESSGAYVVAAKFHGLFDNLILVLFSLEYPC
jgi:hypothetical protein